jgi:hypothetical protein
MLLETLIVDSTGIYTTTSKMIVKDLGGADNLTVAGFTNLGNQAIVGEQMGVLVGSRVLRDTTTT